MNNFVALPLVATLIVVSIGSRWLARLRPSAAAHCSAVLLGASAIAAVPTLWLIGLSGLAHTGMVNPITDWSAHLLPNHRPLGAVVGAVSLGMALTGSVLAVRVLIHHRRLRTTGATEPVAYIDTDEVYAYTLPGPARTIAISDGLRRTLDDDELDFVIAHERAHARYRHDRYKLLALMATAFVPPVATVATRLEYHLERWADEEAIRDTGADRQLAARTIAKVALAGTTPNAALGIGEHGVAARATAMLSLVEQPAHLSRALPFTLITATLGLALYQLHHTVMFAAELVR
jgi:Zn-dependent protease with chaperone function